MIGHQNQRKIRRLRVRKKISGTAAIPRLTVFRSNKKIYAQLIDDIGAKTLVAAVEHDVRSEKLNKIQIAAEVGSVLAKNALKKGIKKIVFDRGGYQYHGRVSALAEGARKGGLIF